MHLPKPGIFRILEYPEPFHNCIFWHIENPLIFMKIGRLCVTLEIQNPSILTILDSSELWHILNLTHIQNPLKDSRWSVLQKYLKATIVFSYIRSLTEFWICPSLINHSITCRVISRYVLYETYSEPCLLL